MSLTQVLEDLEWDTLATSEWKTLESIYKLLRPFAQYTSLASGEEYTTISCITPILMELDFHLNEMKKVAELHTVSTHLQSELGRRFQKCTDPTDPDHEPLYLVSTLLDPRYRVLLTPTQSDSAKEELLKYLKDVSGSVTSSSVSSAASPEHETDEAEEPPKKQFHHLSKVLEQKLKEGMKKAEKAPPGKEQLELYLQNIQSIPEGVDPLR